MAIAFLISSLNCGGAERVVSLLSKYVAENNKVFVITLNNSTPFYEIDSRVHLIQLVSNNKKNILNSIFYNFKIILNLIKIIRKNNISRFISFMPTSNLFLIVCSFFIAKIHITISERSNPNVNLFKKKSRSFLRKLLYRFSDQLVVQTPYVKEYFEAYVKADKIKIIKNPIEIINTKSFDKKNVILTVGTLNKNKNQALILKSFSQLNAPDWELHICGDGGEIDNLKRLAVDLNVENKVKFFGVVSNVEDYFSYASVFAFSSLSEGFPNVILEAMNNNCACISTDCPTGPSELIEHKKNGFLIALNETSAYTSYLQKLVDSENLRNQFCVESKIRIQKYSLPNIAKQWIS